MLDAETSLLYVGKASNIKRRLEGHSRGPKHPDDVRGRRLASTVREVRFIPCESEREALCLEADLVIAFVPPHNASMAFDTYTYVRIETDARRVRFVLTDDASSRPGRLYGGFPHLGKGRGSWRGARTSAGYSALMRLLWAAFADGPTRTTIPRRLHPSSPPVDHTSPFDPSHMPALHDFYTGRSARLLRTLKERTTDDDIPAYMRGALMDDLVGAEEFHVIGPRRLNRLRTRHGLAPGPIDRETFVRLITDDTLAAVGAFRVSVTRPRRGRRIAGSGEA
jgi:hypothetical protein